MWTIDGETATLAHPRLQGTVDLTRPWCGLHNVRLDGVSLAANVPEQNQILGVDFRSESADAREQITDCYVRGSDLVATYSDPPPRRIRPQVYWRVIDDFKAGGVGLETIVSMQTDLLDSRPAAASLTCLPAVEAYRLTEKLALKQLSLSGRPTVESAQDAVSVSSLFLLRLAAGGPSYVEMAHRSDIHSAELDQLSSNDIWLRFHLFEERLEKGVIRRARVRGMFVSREKDHEAAGNCYRSFLDSQLPLTT